MEKTRKKIHICRHICINLTSSTPQQYPFNLNIIFYHYDKNTMTVQSLSRTAPTNEVDKPIYFGITSFGVELLASPNSTLLLCNAPLLLLLVKTHITISADIQT